MDIRQMSNIDKKELMRKINEVDELLDRMRTTILKIQVELAKEIAREEYVKKGMA